MSSVRFPHEKLPRLVSVAIITLGISTAWVILNSPVVSSQSTSFQNFESPQVHPIALTPDGTRLLAVNSPNGTLSVFQLANGTPPRLTAEIPVGLEPVSVAARNNNEAWVVNWLSDSVSIIDLATGNVARTIDVGDEPTDVVFAGSSRQMAFVCVSGGASLLSFTPVDRLGRGQVKVFDAANPTFSSQTIEIFGKQPRALARNADGSRVFVSVFESGNQTTVVKQSDVTANGGLPPPNPALRPGLPAPPNTALIVKWNGSQWLDELSRPWNNSIPYTLADVDLAVIDASGTNLPSSVNSQVSNIGTHIGNMAFDPTQNRLLVANLEDINQVRFEPNLSGRFQHTRVSIVNTAGSVTPIVTGTIDLNSHVNFSDPAGSDAERSMSLALPADIVRKSDGTFFVAATSSARVGVLSTNGVVTDRIAVGQGPTGLAIDESRQLLYVLNRFDETVGVVDTNAKVQIAQVPVGFNPEPQVVRDGRRFLYDGSFSAHGTVSCASCHLNGHRDGMVWDLGNPLGQVDPVTVFFPFPQPGLTGSDNLHPMKGPMMTQSLRGIIGNEPFHWRGDRAGIESFNPAFVSLLGGPRQLTAGEMGAFKAFVQSLVYPPNPNEDQNRPPNETQIGFSFFSFNNLDGRVGPCAGCHLVTGFKPGTDNKITPSLPLQEPQSVKVPQLRGLYQKIGIHRDQATPQIAGFGLIHDGTFDTLFNFMKAPQFDFAEAGSEATADSWRRDMEQLMLRLDSGTPPAIGLMVTVDATNKGSFNVTGRINLLMQQAQAGNCDLVVHGLYGGSPRGFLFSNGQFQPDSLTEAPASLQTLLNAAGPRGELTFVGVPHGDGRTRSIDLDGNGILNDDEPHTSVQLRARVLNQEGNGVAGVTITLSGSQFATAQTDSTGSAVFNFVSTTGTHMLTPSQGGASFGPANRTFASPATNQVALFTTPPSGPFITPLGNSNNVIDTVSSFVTQQYADFLSRDPDTLGLAFWQDQIKLCGANVACVEVSRVNVSAAFYLSIEFQETGYLVYRVYKASFGNLPGKPVPVTYQQLMTDTRRIGRNVIVREGNWQAQLETNKQAFFTGWVQRGDFLARFPLSMSPANFVDTLNGNTGNLLSTAERDALVNQLTANNTTQGRASAVRQVSENAAFTSAEFNRAFVLMQYFGYLRRNPDDAPDTDFTGLQFWLTKLDKFDGNFINAEMVKAFILSAEYRQRFGP